MNGNYMLQPGTQTLVLGDNPVYRARIAMALPVNSWPYAPTSGHQLAQYSQVHQSQANIDSYEKSLKLYLAPYGPKATSEIIKRGIVELQFDLTKETING